jgi:hypothetical protein
MQVSQTVFSAGKLPQFRAMPASPGSQLALIFGSTAMLGDPANFAAVRVAYPFAIIAGCSTAGEIHGATVSDDTVAVTVVSFAHTQVRLAKAEIAEASQSFAVGQALVDALPSDGLRHVLIFSDGIKVNGTELVRGLRDKLPPAVEVTGGLSADGANFKRTLVCADGMPAEGQIAVVGLYGESIRIGYGSQGGWDSFGLEREITRSEGNVLYDLDGKPALQLYKHYLGEHAGELPSSALLFPLSLRYPERDGTVGAQSGVVRTILGIDEAEQSMTFAGDMPLGGHARLMKANFDGLIEGASDAAKISAEALQGHPAQLALLISCVGRKLVLKQRVEEEVEGVREALGKDTVLSGFYSYGEISPHGFGDTCELHNQTMTVTTFCES